MSVIARRFLTLPAAVAVGVVLGALIGGGLMGSGWGASMILGGCVGAVLGMLYDPRAATYTVPTGGGALYPDDRDDWVSPALDLVGAHGEAHGAPLQRFRLIAGR